MSVIYLEMYKKLMDGKLCIKASVVTCSQQSLGDGYKDICYKILSNLLYA